MLESAIFLLNARVEYRLLNKSSAISGSVTLNTAVISFRLNETSFFTLFMPRDPFIYYSIER